MLKIFLYPIWYVVGVLLLGALSLGSDVMTLTNFNMIDNIKNNAPHSYIYILFVLTLIYLVIVLIRLYKYQNTASKIKGNTKPSKNISQKIKSRDVNNSTIIQSGRDTKR